MTTTQTKSALYALLASRERACPAKGHTTGLHYDHIPAEFPMERSNACSLCHGTGLIPLLPGLSVPCTWGGTKPSWDTDECDKWCSWCHGSGYTVVESFTALLVGIREAGLMNEVLHQAGRGLSVNVELRGAYKILTAPDPERAFLEAAIAATEDGNG